MTNSCLVHSSFRPAEFGSGLTRPPRAIPRHKRAAFDPLGSFSIHGIVCLASCIVLCVSVMI